MDTSENPCMDFYNFACGGFIKKSYLNWDRTRIRENPDVLMNKYVQFLADELSTPVHQEEAGNLVNKLRSMYHICQERAKLPASVRRRFAMELMETLKTSQEGTETTLTEIISLATKLYGASPFFKLLVDKKKRVTVLNRFSDDMIKNLFRSKGETVANFRFLAPKDFYYRFPNDKVFISYRTFVRRTINKIFSDDSGNSVNVMQVEDINQALTLEMKINQLMYNEYSEDVGSRSCYDIPISTLQDRFSFKDFSWLSFFRLVLGSDFNVTSDFKLCHADLSSSVFEFIRTTNVSILKDYVILHTLLNTEAFPLLIEDMGEIEWSSSIYKNTHLNDTNVCVTLMRSSLPLSSLLHLSNKEHFEKTVTLLFSSLKAALIGTVRDIYWMPSNQRDNLVRHIDTVTMEFEWSPWKFYTTKLTSELLNINENNFFSVFNEISKLKHFYYWKGLKPTLNVENTGICNFNSDEFSMEISAASMLNPLFYTQTNIPIQFGSTGAFLATTLTKAFDIDALLNHYMTGTIDIRVALTMAQHLQCLTDTFEQYTLRDSVGNTHNVRGDLTKGQTFRDALALLITYEAFLTNSKHGYDRISLPGLNVTDEQLFFLTYAQTFCEKTNSKGIENYYIGENISYLPHQIRINGAFSNFRRFSNSYGCDVGKNMNPLNKCIIF